MGSTAKLNGPAYIPSARRANTLTMPSLADVCSVLVVSETDVERLRLARCLDQEPSLSWGDSTEVPLDPWPGVVVVAAVCCTSAFCLSRIEQVREEGRVPSTVLVTELNAENAREVRHVWEGLLVWFRELEDRFVPAICTLLERDVCHSVFELFSTSIPKESPDLRRTFRHALLGHTVPLHYEELVEVSGLKGSEFREEVRRWGIRGRAEVLFDLAILSHWCRAHEGGEGLNRFCYRVGLDPGRVQRAAYRRVGRAAGAVNRSVLVRTVNEFLPQSGSERAVSADGTGITAYRST